MNWKKTAKYFFLFLVLGIIVLAIWANNGMIQLYGGKTLVVDYKQFNQPSNAVCITNINVLSTDATHFIPRQTVCIDKGVITSVDTIFTNLEGFKVIDGGGKYLIPGLIDSHVHLFKSPNDLLLYIANGITQVREMIGEPDHLTWREEIKNGRIGPELYVASPRYGSFSFWEGLMMTNTQGFVNVNNEKEAKENVIKHHKQGYNGIKIYSHLKKESYIATCRTADSLGMDVIGHIPFRVTLSDVWNGSQKEIAHFEEIMNALNREFDYFGNDDKEAFFKFIDQRSDSIAMILNKKNIAVTSSLSGDRMGQMYGIETSLKSVKLEYENPGISEGHEILTPQGGLGWLPSVNRTRNPTNLTDEQKAGRKKWWTIYNEACAYVGKNLAARGVKIFAGTDANLSVSVPGFSLHDELKNLNEIGMTPTQVLKSATSLPAEWLKTKSGKIEKGYKANLVLLDKNPLEDISNTQTINSVILNGRVLDRALLDEILSTVKKANDSSRKKDISQFFKR